MISKKKVIDVLYMASIPIGIILWVLPIILLNTDDRITYLGISFLMLLCILPMAICAYSTFLILSSIYLFTRFIYFKIIGKVDKEEVELFTY